MSICDSFRILHVHPTPIALLIFETVVCLDSSILLNNILLVSKTYFLIYFFIFSITFLWHMHCIIKNVIVLIPNNISNNTLSKHSYLEKGVSTKKSLRFL